MPTPTDSAAAYIARQRRQFQLFLRVRELLLEELTQQTRAELHRRFVEVRVEPPRAVPTAVQQGSRSSPLIDREKQRAYSQFLRATKLPLGDFVRLLRGETELDPRSLTLVQTRH